MTTTNDFVDCPDHHVVVGLHERLDRIEDRQIRIEEKLDKIHTVLDLAFTRFESLSRSPMMASLLGTMGMIGGTKKEQKT